MLSCLLAVEGWTETPVDCFRSEVRVELDFLLSLKDESSKCCLSDGDRVSGLPGPAQLEMRVPISLYLLTNLEIWKFGIFPSIFLHPPPSLCKWIILYLISSEVSPYCTY